MPTVDASVGSTADRRARRDICGPFVWSNSYPTLVLRAATSRYGVWSKLLRILQSTYSVVTFAGPCAVSYQGILSRATPCTAQTQRRSLPGTERWSSPLACRGGHYYSCVLHFVSTVQQRDTLRLSRGWASPMRLPNFDSRTIRPTSRQS